HDPRTGRVTLMVHTFVGDDLDTVRETVKGPFCSYLQTSLSLIKNLVVSVGMDVDPEGLSPEDAAALLDRAFDRYFEAAGLFGTPETCRRTLERFQALGVDEVACLIDFGVETERVLAALPNLVELRERCRRPDPEEAAASLAAQVVRHGVTHLQCTPSLAGMLVLDGAAASALASLRCLMVGGEAFPPALAQRLAEVSPAAIHNMYGPTETTIWSSTWAVPRETGAGGAVSIGRPIANTSLHLVDHRLRPVPLGLSGELLIGGLGVVRGYLDRPELTAERFVPDPFGDLSGAGGARLYRTGDLARRRADGTIEFLGRLDHQVKIRGIRIELGEIEAQLARHPLVREAVVVARGGAAGEARLAAYLVPRRWPLGPAELAELDGIDGFLRQSLPDVMVPAAYVPLEAFPLTPNRKVDRKALPDPEPVARESALAADAPRTPTEEVVAEIWAAVLGVDRVGVRDGFFDLGGHSLLATQVVSRVRETFRIDLPLRSLFEAPTVEGLAQAIERLRQTEQGREAPPLAAGPRDGEAPLSFSQERIWFLNQLAPGSAYNDFTAFRLLGDLDAGALERSLGEIARRHEALRTAFAAAEGRPRPVVADAPRLDLPVVDLRLLAAPARQAALERLARQAARGLFDLGQAPLLRALLLRLGPQEHALCLTIHHIATDGWSWRVLFRELAQLYDAFAAGRPSPLPALPVQYADFARWQRAWLRGEVLERQLAYWREALRGRLPVLDLPADRPRPAVQSFRGATRAFALPVGLGAALRGLGRGERATLFMTLLAVFEVLLHRLSGQDDLLVGTPVANRNHSELEALIGVFVNTLVLRTDASGEPTFRELLARVREVALGAYAHQDLPFEKLVDALQVERDLSHTPLFQVAFVLQNAPLEVLELEQLSMRPLEIDPGSAKFDLTLALSDRGAALQGWLEYNTDVFDAATMERLLGAFARLADGAAADPGRRIAELPLLSEAERHALLAEWSGGAAAFPAGETIAGLFARQADENPAGIALSWEAEEVTYAELEERANRLAHYLIERGVGPEIPVGLHLERGIDLVVALLAVLKAGGAYVPLDPSYPAERLAFMLEDSGAPVLVTRRDLPAGLPGAVAGGCDVVLLDEQREEIGRRSPERPEGRATAAGSAYVIFTSGSTGRPKGVMVSHGNVVRLLRATEPWFGFGPSDVWTLFHSSAFDFSVWELWGALAYGGRLVVVPFWVSRSPEAFHELLVRERVTVLNQTPSAFRQLIHAEALAGRAGELALRLVIFGGEALELRSLEPWYAHHADDRPRLVNMYGITETTVHVTYRPLTSAEARAGAGSVIGVPIPDLTTYVLDPWGNPVPPGVPGELCVGGAGLARGYLGRPELTAARFVPDPFGGASGARLYRSGDLVRFLTRGELEYLGRIDHQVKVRGFRIELGEIEAALAAHPGVREAVVAPRAGRLVAWVVPAAAEAADAVRESDLHAHLHSRLPDYMVPAAFVVLEALPTTPSGKVDRRALPEPGAGRPRLEGEYAAPRNPLEESLAAVWREVLSLERVGIHDNFFRLGGDSILIIQIVARARAAGLALTPRQLFEHQTVAELAAVAGAPGWAGGEETVSGPVPLTPIQRWFFERELEEPDHFNLAVLLEVRAGWDAAALRRAVELLPRHHDALRLRAARRDGSWHQEAAPPDGLPALTAVDLSALPEPAHAGALRE
ncbi:MAG TPA: amino acid adenylation domain-containing protein, partial [Thermoanaerobaculia bacterium]|nr:amino acid adenylation domain-containing protein [Thermoanaerobaculia bacterium]